MEPKPSVGQIVQIRTGYYLFYGGGGSAIENALYSLVYYTNTSSVDTNYVYPSKIISLGAWHHLALTLKSNGKAIFYVDGSMADTRTATNFSHWGRANAASSNTSLAIGNSLKSSIDAVRIYSSEMTLSQIKQQYLAGLERLLANNKITEEEYAQRIIN